MAFLIAVTDMITLARNHAISAAVLLSEGEDLRVGVRLPEGLGELGETMVATAAWTATASGRSSGCSMRAGASSPSRPSPTTSKSRRSGSAA